MITVVQPDRVIVVPPSIIIIRGSSDPKIRKRRFNGKCLFEVTVVALRYLHLIGECFYSYWAW